MKIPEIGISEVIESMEKLITSMNIGLSDIIKLVKYNTIIVDVKYRIKYYFEKNPVQ